MSTAPVLVVGGSGVVGRFALRWLRERHPDLPVVVGGRNLDTAREAARLIALADAAEVDLPEQLSDPAWFIARLREAGATVRLL